MPCTIKSKSFHSFFMAEKTSLISLVFVTSQLKIKFEFVCFARGSTLFLKVSPCYVYASFAPFLCNKLAIPQASEWLFATPIIKPFLFFIKGKLRLGEFSLVFWLKIFPYLSGCLNVRVALVPPKPKLFDNT